MQYQVEVDVLSYRTHIPVTLHMRHCRQKADVTHEDWFHMVSGNYSVLGSDAMYYNILHRNYC